jgi:hypothetical protein
VIDHVPLLDELLEAHGTALGADRLGYRNHCYRVLNLCVALSPSAREQLEKVAIAAAFHDLAIWTDRTFDYLAPSRALAQRYLDASARAAWKPELEAMIMDHHKLRPSRARRDWLVEPFRRADWIDVSYGLVRMGLPRTRLRELFAAFPDAGFHARLLRLSLRRLWTHPFRPFPMLKF